jgi:hypothetical protein
MTKDWRDGFLSSKIEGFGVINGEGLVVSWSTCLQLAKESRRLGQRIWPMSYAAAQALNLKRFGFR